MSSWPATIIAKDSQREHPWLISQDNGNEFWVTTREAPLWGFVVDENAPDGECSIEQTRELPAPPFDRSVYWP
jgi:hypothetical protein